MKFSSSLLLLLAHSTASLVSDLPTIDLGYVRQRATEYNTTTGLYIYRNVRYARPPLADLRFRKPQPPLPEPAGTISDGSQYKTTVCPQAVSTITPSTNGFSEDCLFLDIYVPSGVNPGDDLPVLVWIYGGGYIIGSKDDIYMNPLGLFRAAQKHMIFVALNYRLGAFGWASPPSEKTIDPNVGLHDAREALQWIQHYINKFGGNAADVTVFGESAGGGVIMHSITAYGGDRDPPLFHKAILQSPGFIPTKGNPRGRDDRFKEFMAKANCSDLGCLRRAPTQVLMEVNSILNQNVFAPGFAVVVDGDFVPDLPSRLFLQGRYHKTLTAVIAANNEHEGRILLPTSANVTIDDFNRFLTTLVPNMTKAGQDAARALYLDPASQESIWDRTTDFISDAVFTCNAQVVASSNAAHGDKTFRYIFAVPPAKHGDDVPYTFYSNGDNPSDVAVANTSAASALLNIITSLAITGAPESAPHMLLEKYGVMENILVVNETFIAMHAGDPWKSRRCALWQNALYVQG